jgi:CRISPR-associated endonuclease/helicase Cas3
VIEHHSNVTTAESDAETSAQRLASENWDAPVIVTTNVQLFESLYAARTSHCRKLHNIAGSVILLDEAHLMPPQHRKPILHALRELVRHYRVSVVLCTATPTGIESMEMERRYVEEICPIIADPDALYARLERVRVQVRPEAERVTEWDGLAAELAQHAQALCIVNRRDDCRELYARLREKAPEGAIHLSGLMCAAHRSEVIGRIKADLEAKRPVRVISTQLVEAGVDVDFPVVYRAMAGLDSIAQAAGRCNREGKNEAGQVIVFYPPKDAPKGMLLQAQQAAQEILRRNPDGNVLSPTLQAQYFKNFYGRCPKGDANEVLKMLAQSDELRYQFRSAAEAFKLIEDAYLPVIVRYQNDDDFKRLKDGNVERWLLRKLQRSIVTIPEGQHKALEKAGAIKMILPKLYVQEAADLYHEEEGLAKAYESFRPEPYVL